MKKKTSKKDEPIESLPSVLVNASNAEIYDSVDAKKIVKFFRSHFYLERFASAIENNNINDMVSYKKSFEKADLVALEKIYDEYVIKADPVIKMYNEKKSKYVELKVFLWQT